VQSDAYLKTRKLDLRSFETVTISPLEEAGTEAPEGAGRKWAEKLKERLLAGSVFRAVEVGDATGADTELHISGKIHAWKKGNAGTRAAIGGGTSVKGIAVLSGAKREVLLEYPIDGSSAGGIFFGAVGMASAAATDVDDVLLSSTALLSKSIIHAKRK